MNMLKTKTLILLCLLALVFSVGLGTLTYAAPAPAAVDSKGEVCKGAGLVGGGTDCNTTGGPSVQGVIRTSINFLSVIVVMIIVGGVKFVTSGGSAEKVASARSTVLYAAIGLIIVAFAQIIVRFVLSKASKAT